MIASWFTWQAISGVLGAIWSGFCKLIGTPVGAAAIAALIAYNVGVYHERGKLNAAWQAKWDAAEAQAERDRIKRDASIKTLVEADANVRIDALTKRKDDLEQQVKAYELEEAGQKPVAGPCPCLTDESDDEWLRRAQRGHLKP